MPLTQGVPPGSPSGLSATNTSQLVTVQFTWNAPASSGSGISYYNILVYDSSNNYLGNISTPDSSLNYRGNSYLSSSSRVQFFAQGTHYRFTVQAVGTGGSGPASSVATVTTTSAPSAPLSFTATPDPSISGQINLTWTTPSSAGSSAITGYQVWSSTNTQITSLASTARSYSVTGLTPGIQYGFFVQAANSYNNSTFPGGTPSPTIYAVAPGAPAVPSSCVATPSMVVPGRLTLTWTEAGTYTGFNVYDMTSGTAVFLASVTTPQYIIDNLSSGTHSYQIAGRNSATDATTPPTEGTRSAVFSGVPGSSSTQSISSTSVTDVTNGIFNGTYTVAALTASSLTYNKTNANIAPITQPASSGTVTDTTLAALNGTYPITAIPTASTFQYAKTVASSPTVAVSSATVTNVTNAEFVGTYLVTAVDNTNKLVSYNVTGANVASSAAIGTITNGSNTVYNGTNITITGTTSNTLTYAKTNADIAETGASGTIIDLTNQSVYNALPTAGGGSGPVTVISTPAYNIFTYAKTNANLAQASVADPFGFAYRATSKANLDIKYRSGWAG